MPPTFSPGSRSRDAITRAFEPLWISGLVLLILFSLRLFKLDGEKFDWTEHMLLGTLFPVLLVLLAGLGKFRPELEGLLQKIRLALGSLVILIPMFVVHVGSFKYVLIISLAQWLIALQYSKRLAEREGKQTSWERTSLTGISLLVVITLSWIVATKYIWWASYQDFILGANSSFIIFIIALLAVVVTVYDATPIPGEVRREPLRLVGNVLAILFIAMACVRTDHIFGLGEVFHWMSFTGPAESVRQGGWLLWDVPSHYGFLSVLTLAWLPTRTAWQSVFMLNALLNFLIALMIFFLFRALRPGLLNLFFALIITLAAVFFRSGLAVYFLGPNNLPNIGGLRFFWCFALVAVLFWEYRWGNRDTRPHRIVLWAGCVIWLIGTLWSVESAVYCSVIWLPAFALLVWQGSSASGYGKATFGNRLRSGGRWVLLPPALLLGAVILITAYYLARLGHAPDWRSYVEYARAYSGGFMAMPINPGGEVWVLVLVFCAFATTAVYFFLSASRDNAILPLILGTGGGLWATGSYFVSRSHPNNAHNLSIIFCAAIGLTLYLLTRERQQTVWALLVKSALAPVLTIVLVADFANKEALKDYIMAPQASYVKIERLVPVSDTALDDLMNSAHVTPEDPIVYVGQSDLLVFTGWTYAAGGKQEKFSAYKSWLPIPLYSFVPLNDERRNVYLSRFTTRTHMSGWLIEHKYPLPNDPVYPWFSEYIKVHYSRGRTFESENWRLTWCDYKG
jgi:hypothetical protein